MQTKRGVLTSWDVKDGPKATTDTRKQAVIVSQYSNSSYPNVVNPNLTVDELQGTKYAQSIGFQGERPEMHSSYGQGVKSHFVPPPPQQFLVGSTHTYSQPSHPSQLPINSNSTHIQAIHSVQPLYQSIKRTFIPHHIYNEIPVMSSETKRYEVEEEIKENEEGINEADQQMLEQYEKLYATYTEERQKNEHLERQLQDFQRRINEPRPVEVREVVHTREVMVDRPKKIDVKLLGSLLLNRNRAVIYDLVDRRKHECLGRLQKMFAEEEFNLKTTLVRSTEEIVRVRIR